MRVTVPNTLSNLESIKDVQRFLSAWVSQVTQQINGNLTFHQNIRSSELTSVAFANSSDVQSVSHSLGRVPSGILTVKQTAPASIYAPSGAAYSWTINTIYLQSDAGVTASIFII